MNQTLSDLHPALATAKLDLKFFVKRRENSPGPEELIPVFHRFIQQNTLPDLLIDVADYSHVPNGPGVLLVAHDAQFGYEDFEGRGLLYSRRRETQASNQHDGSSQGRFRSLFKAALGACRSLETDALLEGRLEFSSERILFRINDRLAASASDETLDTSLRPLLEQWLGETLADPKLTVIPARHGRDEGEDHRQAEDNRYSLEIRPQAGLSTAGLLERLSA